MQLSDFESGTAVGVLSMLTVLTIVTSLVAHHRETVSVHKLYKHKQLKPI